MPELPEVETVRRQLEPAIVGRRIASAEVLDERWTRPDPPREVERALHGRTIETVERRGKYLILGLDDGRALVMHLRMTGNLLLRLPSRGGGNEAADLMKTDAAGPPRSYESAADPRHLRARIRLDDGSQVLFVDARRLGHGAVLGDAGLEEYFAARLGLEPLSEALTAEEIARLAAGRRAPLKSFLMNQVGIAGIGNIYADEALHRAKLHPLSPAGSLKIEDCERLCEGIVAALEAGLRAGGASVDDYRDARGDRGAMQEEFLVHTREGKPCPRCGAEIRRIVVAGRSTYFCPSCQRRLRRRPRRRAARSRSA
jgi:formamidopyrimidine-DNA glycosylase